MLADKRYKEIIVDLLNYGLITYENRFGSENFGVPFLSYMNSIKWWMQHFYLIMKRYIVPLEEVD